MKIRSMTIEEYQSLLHVSMRKKAPQIWLKNARFLNVYTGQVEQGQIYIAGNRVAYVGQKEPLVSNETEIIELASHQVVVPGYIEPHAHPFQWYNPLEWGRYVTTQGTTTSINDNMALFLKLTDEQALQFIQELDEQGFHLWLWWSRFDGQTNTGEQIGRFNDQTLRTWLSHPLVVQGGEFTSWPYFIQGEPNLTKWMLMTKQDFGKRIEGHLPGASFETLNTLAAAGVSADHESLHGEDVLNRLRLGYYVSLRYSSIRPDLPQILEELKGNPEVNLSRIMLTNDGASPFFVQRSGMNEMIKLVMKAGFGVADAYRMATLNPATYYGLDQELGGIAPGRLAHLNVVETLDEPTPSYVMVDGKWVVRNGQSLMNPSSDWLFQYFKPKEVTWDLSRLLQIRDTGTTGIELINEVITRPYSYSPSDSLVEDEAYLMLVDHEGRWGVHTRIKGYSTKLVSLASTYTASKDYILIGNNREDMVQALRKALEMGGGIVATFENGERLEIPLTLAGGMSREGMKEVVEYSQHFVQMMQKDGHAFADPIYTLLFLTATHLPFIRMTNEGVYLIKEQKVVSAKMIF